MCMLFPNRSAQNLKLLLLQTANELSENRNAKMSRQRDGARALSAHVVVKETMFPLWWWVVVVTARVNPMLSTAETPRIPVQP